mmetsp:Transcript_134732/g.430379  ORF Transcript_134732/g.430379 Transcript_134732/m.430379 type:complete len:124 (+) Transcript_134732:2-373(+)
MGDYLVVAACVAGVGVMLFLGTAACMDFRSAPPETTRRRHAIDVSEAALRADFEQVCLATTVAEERGVEEGAVNAEDLPYAQDEPCIICFERKEARQPGSFSESMPTTSNALISGGSGSATGP